MIFFNKLLHENTSEETVKLFSRRFLKGVLTVRAAVVVEMHRVECCALSERPPPRLESGIKFRTH